MQNISPKARRRYESIIAAATNEFITNGYSKTNLTDIIKRSGGSLSTIYELFGDKQGLFKAVLWYMADRFKRDLEEHIQVEAHSSLEELLKCFARQYLKIIFDEKIIKFRKLIIAEKMNERSELDSSCLMISSNVVLELLAQIFGHDKLRVHFGEADLKLLAFRFCMLIEEPHIHIASLTGVAPRFTNEELEAWIGECVGFFMRAAVKESKEA